MCLLAENFIFRTSKFKQVRIQSAPLFSVLDCIMKILILKGRITMPKVILSVRRFYLPLEINFRLAFSKYPKFDLNIFDGFRELDLMDEVHQH